MIDSKIKKGSIGVFDSGFGGLYVLRHLNMEIPEYNFVYLGDTARAPYGSCSPDVVYEFVKQAVDFLFNQGCLIVILACNTASSDALRRIQQDYLPIKYPGRRVLGVLIPTVEYIVENAKTKNKRVGIIATEGTVNSKAFIKEFYKIDPSIEIFQNSCPLLVPLIESGESNLKTIDSVLKIYLKPLVDKKIDTLILGCTHYDIIRNEIDNIVGDSINLVSANEILSIKLKRYLNKHQEIDSLLLKEGEVKIYTTDLTDKFEILGSKFFGQKIRPLRLSLKLLTDHVKYDNIIEGKS